MDLLNLIVWLSAGAVIGWIARWMVRVEHKWTHRSSPGEDRHPKKQ